MSTEPEASPRTPTGETPMSTTPEIRHWQRIDRPHVIDHTSSHWPATVETYEADERYREVTVAPVDGSRPDSDVIERAREVMDEIEQQFRDAHSTWSLDTDPSTARTPPPQTPTNEQRAHALAAAGLLTPSDTFASTKPSDADVALMRRAAASERAAERHWPADMLAQAADTIERLRTDLAANPDADVAEVERLRAEVADLRENPRDEHHTMRELYDYRMLYNAHAAHGWLAAGIPVVKSWRHGDGEECFGGGWFIVTATLPAGQVSNHYKAEHWDLFRVPEALPPAYDGHAPTDAAERLRAPLPDADVTERIARAWDEGYTAGSQDGSIIGVGRTANPYHATPPVAATGEEADHG